MGNNPCPPCDVLIISEYLDICMQAKTKNLTILVDEYKPAFEVYDKEAKPRVLIGSCMSLLELAEIIYDHPRKQNFGGVLTQ